MGSKGELPLQNLQIELMICLRMQQRICHCSVASKIGVLCKLMNLILIGEKCPKVITMYIINLPLLMNKIFPISFFKVSYTTKSSGNASASPDWYDYVGYLTKGDDPFTP